jgi:hypothetical protein
MIERNQIVDGYHLPGYGDGTSIIRAPKQALPRCDRKVSLFPEMAHSTLQRWPRPYNFKAASDSADQFQSIPLHPSGMGMRIESAVEFYFSHAKRGRLYLNVSNHWTDTFRSSPEFSNRLVSATSEKHGSDGLIEDAQIEPHGPIPDVKTIKLDPLFVGNIVTAGNLPQASDAPFHACI